MGRKRGRPRKKVKNFTNPFGLKLGRINGGARFKAKGPSTVSSKKLTKTVEVKVNHEAEARGIIDTAVDLGLSIPLGRSKGVQELSNALAMGDL